jgi:hypothetical protein
MGCGNGSGEGRGGGQTQNFVMAQPEALQLMCTPVSLRALLGNIENLVSRLLTNWALNSAGP